MLLSQVGRKWNPHGSVVEPVLLQLFIHDVTTNLKREPILYANDLRLINPVQAAGSHVQL